MDNLDHLGKSSCEYVNAVVNMDESISLITTQGVIELGMSSLEREIHVHELKQIKALFQNHSWLFHFSNYWFFIQHTKVNFLLLFPDMSELEEWVYEQRMAKWRAEHFATTASVTTHFVLQSNTPPSNQTGNLVELLLQQQNQQHQQQTPQLRNAKACVPSVLKRVLAELIGERWD